MEDLPLGRIAALVPEFAVKDLPLVRTLIMMMMYTMLHVSTRWVIFRQLSICGIKHYFVYYDLRLSLM